MLLRIALLLVLWIVAPVSAVQAQAVVDTVRAVALGIIAADNAKDLPRVLNYYAPDAVLLPPNEPAVTGRGAIRPRYEQLFRQFHLRIETRIDEVRVSGDWAYVRGRNTGTLIPADGGEPQRLSDRYIMILHRDAEEGWRIARLMWHPVPNAP